ncbi:ComF family protein [Alkanindiges sp. WGS2144]|uniref:ComF family protein n=1 Tax=Alkanindiges sp. WGS2144 TaxID=3366808 RepID=UPI0037536D3D
MFKAITALIRPFGRPCLLCQLYPCLAEKSLCQFCWQTMPWCHNPLSFDFENLNIHATCMYAWPVDRLIHLYKYQNRLDLLPILTDLLLQHPKPAVQAIVPVPLSCKRLKQRGFNQALLLAKTLGTVWQIPLWQPLNRHHSIAQQNLSRQERLSNVQGAFYPNVPECRVIPRKVLLVDDVVTTASTLKSMQDALVQLGVQHIECLVIARPFC